MGVPFTGFILIEKLYTTMSLTNTLPVPGSYSSVSSPRHTLPGIDLSLAMSSRWNSNTVLILLAQIILYPPESFFISFSKWEIEISRII